MPGHRILDIEWAIKGGKALSRSPRKKAQKASKKRAARRERNAFFVDTQGPGPSRAQECDDDDAVENLLEPAEVATDVQGARPDTLSGFGAEVTNEPATNKRPLEDLELEYTTPPKKTRKSMQLRFKLCDDIQEPSLEAKGKAAQAVC